MALILSKRGIKVLRPVLPEPIKVVFPKRGMYCRLHGVRRDECGDLENG